MKQRPLTQPQPSYESPTYASKLKKDLPLSDSSTSGPKVVRGSMPRSLPRSDTSLGASEGSSACLSSMSESIMNPRAASFTPNMECGARRSISSPEKSHVVRTKHPRRSLPTPAYFIENGAERQVHPYPEYFRDGTVHELRYKPVGSHISVAPLGKLMPVLPQQLVHISSRQIHPRPQIKEPNAGSRDEQLTEPQGRSTQASLEKSHSANSQSVNIDHKSKHVPREDKKQDAKRVTAPASSVDDETKYQAEILQPTPHRPRPRVLEKVDRREAQNTTPHLIQQWVFDPNNPPTPHPGFIIPHAYHPNMHYFHCPPIFPYPPGLPFHPPMPFIYQALPHQNPVHQHFPLLPMPQKVKAKPEQRREKVQKAVDAQQISSEPEQEPRTNSAEKAISPTLNVDDRPSSSNTHVDGTTDAPPQSDATVESSTRPGSSAGPAEEGKTSRASSPATTEPDEQVDHEPQKKRQIQREQLLLQATSSRLDDYPVENWAVQEYRRTRRGRRGQRKPKAKEDAYDDMLALSTPESEEELAQDKEVKLPEPKQRDGPPPNAPTGPASLRRVSNPNTQSQIAKACNPAEGGSWSQSKRWMSQETKERMVFQKLMQNLRYMGADQSPFVPQTPAELAAFRIEAAEKERNRLVREVERRVAKVKARAEAQKEGGTASHKLMQLFGGKSFDDRLSPLFAVENCFNRDISTTDECRVDWPSLAELKEEGDNRSASHGRYLPLPRMNRVAAKILELENEKAYNSDGSIKWTKKAIKLGSRDVTPVSPATCDLTKLSAEMLPDEAPEQIQTLLKEMDESEQTVEHEEASTQKGQGLAKVEPVK